MPGGRRSDSRNRERQRERRRRQSRWPAVAVRQQPEQEAAQVQESPQEPALQQASWRKQQRKGTKRARTLVARTSLFLVGLDQNPVRIARADDSLESPQIAGLHRIA